MKIAAITRYKQGDLWLALRRLKWTQSELARRTGLSPFAIGQIINMHRRPTPKVGEKIVEALGRAGIYLDLMVLWPESFTGLKNPLVMEQVREMEMERLLPLHPNILELYRTLHEVVAELPNWSKTAIESYFFEGETFKETAKRLGRTSSNQSSRLAKGLRLLRHPTRVKRLALAGFIPRSDPMKLTQDLF